MFFGVIGLRIGYHISDWQICCKALTARRNPQGLIALPIVVYIVYLPKPNQSKDAQMTVTETADVYETEETAVISHLIFDQENFSAIWKLHLKNYLLMILTLGLYRFWAITHIRRFLIPRLSWDEVGFEYTGTGIELFFGFLKVFFFIFLPLILVTAFLLGFDPSLEQSLDSLTSLFVIWFLFPIFRFLSLRYRLTRLRWRGIRGWVNGSPIKYGFLSFALWIATFLSGGLAWPWADGKRVKYLANRSQFGNLSGKLESFTPYLYAVYILLIVSSLVLSAFVAGILFGIANIVVALARVNEMPFVLTYSLFLPLGAILVMYSLMLWYRAAFRVKVLENYTVGELSFSFSASTSQVFRLMLTNRLISIFTLWIAMPVVWRRSLVFISENLEIHGVLDPDKLVQAAEASEAHGEGVMLDFDFA